MSRRIEVELTSARPDGSWTWRAAGAREPKGSLDGALLPSGCKVGDVVRADADMDIDGIAITAVLPPKGHRQEPERIELLATSASFEPVIQTMAPRHERPRGDRTDRPDRGDRRDHAPRGDRPPRSDRPGGSTGPGGPGGPGGSGARRPRPEGSARPEGDRARSDRPRGDRPEGATRSDRPARPAGAERRERPPRPELPAKPKPKRLRAGRVHRNAALAELAPEERAVAEQVLRGGIPAVRQAVSEQNEALAAQGQPTIRPEGILALAERLLPSLRVADWLDRAEGALADIDELDLRDLRSVVAGGEDPVVARDETARALAVQLKAALKTRQDSEHDAWLAEIAAELDGGRSVRALRLSSRPPKAGVRFPPDLAARLAAAASASMTPEAPTERWEALVDALATSPVRAQVHAVGVPAAPSDSLKAAVQRNAGLLPELAAQFGITPPAPGTRPARPPRPPRPPRPAAAAPAAAPVVAAAEPVVEVIETEDGIEVIEVIETADGIEVIDTIETADGIEVIDTIETADGIEVIDTIETADGIEVIEVIETADGIEVIDTIETNDGIEVIDVVELVQTDDGVEIVEIVEVIEGDQPQG